MRFKSTGSFVLDMFMAVLYVSTGLWALKVIIGMVRNFIESVKK